MRDTSTVATVEDRLERLTSQIVAVGFLLDNLAVEMFLTNPF